MTNAFGKSVSLTKDDSVQNITPVRVTKMGQDTLTLDFARETTVSDYLERAGIDVRGDDAITMNGRAVKPGETVDPGATIVVASRVRNG